MTLKRYVRDWNIMPLMKNRPVIFTKDLEIIPIVTKEIGILVGILFIIKTYSITFSLNGL
jgi:hypothetical protein